MLLCSQAVHHDAAESEQGIHGARLVPVFRRLGDVTMDELQVRYIATVTTVVSIFCFIQGGYSLASAASVVMNPKAVKDWRPIFGELSDSYCLRRFWS